MADVYLRIVIREAAPDYLTLGLKYCGIFWTTQENRVYGKTIAEVLIAVAEYAVQNEILPLPNTAPPPVPVLVPVPPQPNSEEIQIAVDNIDAKD